MLVEGTRDYIFKEPMMMDEDISKKTEVIPGVTKAAIDRMADFVFSRVDGNHPEFADSSDDGDIVRILNEGSPLVDKSPAFIRKFTCTNSPQAGV
jgi:hypothetical protein